ncbi:MAG: carbohydrate binding family 9 domain-containing protein [bacterium]|nr:carbohydrate binding family 9 domain-containing protein [bacterium]
MRKNPFPINRIDSKIKIDGILEEVGWEKAHVIGLPWEVGPGENEAAPVKTEVLILHGKTHFYIGFRCFDPAPDKIRAHFTDRDNISGDDEVRVFIDTFNDKRSAFMLSCNPLGVQQDLYTSPGSTDKGWDAIYYSAGKIHDWGYSVEMAIPFSSLRFQRTAKDQEWGIHFARVYPRSVSHFLWAYTNDYNNNCFICQFGRIKGMKGVSPGRNIEVNPTLTAVTRQERDELPAGDFENQAKKIDAGLTLRWGITPNIAFSGTVNPDFSQVEADALQLDINQPFALFYAEKRPFFVEGSGYFATPLQTVHSRTIRDPSWGIKLTGKEGNNGLGAYIVWDEVTNLIFPGSEESDGTSLDIRNTGTVVRYRRDIFNNSTIGALVTNRQGGDYFNRVFGLDGYFRIGSKDSIETQYLASRTRYPLETSKEYGQPEDVFTGHAMYLLYSHEDRSKEWWAEYKGIAPGFRADQGFIPQVGLRNIEAGGQYSWRAKPGKWWSQFRVGGEAEYIEDWDKELLDKNIRLWLSFDGAMQSFVHMEVERGREGYNGSLFDLTQLAVYSAFRPLSNVRIDLDVEVGDNIDYDNTRKGSRIQLRPAVNISMGKHFRLNLSHVYEHMRVEGQRLYTANISRSILVYHLNRRALFKSVLQYVRYNYNAANYLYEVDPLYEHFGTQLLFSYKLNPRTVMYLGYTDNYYGAYDYSIKKNDYTVFAKVSYAWVF